MTSFAQLLCGEDIQRVMRSQGECAQVVNSFRRLSPDAPLPVPVAAVVTTTHIYNRQLREAASIIASYYKPTELLHEVQLSLRGSTRVVDARTLMELAELLRVSDAPGVQQFIALAADSSLAAGEDVRAEVRPSLHQMITRFIRFRPSAAAALLRPLCLMSSTSKEDREAVLEAVKIAMRGTFTDPADFAAVLDVFARAKDYQRVVSMWSWMRHTSACWDCEAASTVIHAAAQMHFMEEGVAAIQSLAEVKRCPTVSAQCAFLRYLAQRTPPLPAYADQLVSHWHPADSLWLGANQRVGVRLMFVHYHSHNHGRVLELLRGACASWQRCGSDGATVGGGTARASEVCPFLATEGVSLLLRHYGPEISADADMAETFFSAPPEMKDIAELPTVLATYCILGVYMGRTAEVFATLAGLDVSDDCFSAFAKSFAENRQCLRSSRERLDMLREMAEVMRREVPADVAAWLTLAEEAGQ